MYAPRTLSRLVAAGVALALIACGDDPVDPSTSPSAAGPRLSVDGFAPPPPTGLVCSRQIWPWTGRDVDGTIADPSTSCSRGTSTSCRSERR